MADQMIGMRQVIQSVFVFWFETKMVEQKRNCLTYISCDKIE